MCPTNAATKCVSCYPNFLLSSTGNSCDPFDSSALETLTLDRNTLQTGLDSCSMMNFGFGFFVYVISITLAMFCVVANYIVRSRKKRLSRHRKRMEYRLKLHLLFLLRKSKVHVWWNDLEQYQKQTSELIDVVRDFPLVVMKVVSICSARLSEGVIEYLFYKELSCF